MKIEEANQKRESLIHAAVRKLIRLRNEHLNEVDFGNAVAPIVDSLVFDLSELPSQWLGKWTPDEEERLMELHKSSPSCAVTIERAANVLNRTESQITSKLRNMGLYRYGQ